MSVAGVGRKPIPGKWEAVVELAALSALSAPRTDISQLEVQLYGLRDAARRSLH
jgi:hypothetical protein